MIGRRTRGITGEAKAAERARVQALIKRDQAYRHREDERKAAELEVAKGLTVNIGEAVDEPTPEWLAKGDYRTFTPRLEDGTVRTVKAYRRISTPVVVRLWKDGRITDDQLKACVFFRDRYEQAGVTGRFKTSYISLTGNVGGSGGMAQSPMALHEREAEARMEYRAACEAITPAMLPFFQAVTLHDMPLSRAVRLARCRNDQALARFRTVAQELVDHCTLVAASFSEIDVEL